MSHVIPASEWLWFGSPAHFVCALDCRFHMATQVGCVIVSTVGEYLPDHKTRERLATERDIKLRGRGDERLHDWFKKTGGYEEIGYRRTYETMVFRIAREVCAVKDCGCGMPLIASWTELDAKGYSQRGAATFGHREMCAEWATGQEERLVEARKLPDEAK